MPSVTSCSRGFTLIELIITVIIIALLAAFALPRFINFKKEAEQANFDTVFGNFQSAVNTYQLAWAVNNKPHQPFKNYTSYPNALGYPAGGDDPTQAYEGDCVDIWQDLLDTSGQTLPHISGVHTWASLVGDANWMRNATMLPLVGESQDIFCHYVYVGAYKTGAFSGLSGERVPMIQYNIQTGEVSAQLWPYEP